MNKSWRELLRETHAKRELEARMALLWVHGDILNLDVAMYCAAEWQEGIILCKPRTEVNNRGYAYEVV